MDQLAALYCSPERVAEEKAERLAAQKREDNRFQLQMQQQQMQFQQQQQLQQQSQQQFAAIMALMQPPSATVVSPKADTCTCIKGTSNTRFCGHCGKLNPDL